MSTNYYIKADPRPACPCCGHVPSEDEQHLGQAAGGWQFQFKGNRDSTAGALVTTETEWWAEIDRRLSAGQRIWDEYEQEITRADLERTVNGCRHGRARYGLESRYGGWRDEKGNSFMETEFS